MRYVCLEHGRHQEVPAQLLVVPPGLLRLHRCLGGPGAGDDLVQPRQPGARERGTGSPAGSGLNAPAQSSLLAGSAGTTTLMSRVRISAVIPFQREIDLHHFGDAAEDLSNWTLMSPSPGADDRYTIPVGTILLPGESLVIVVEEGGDAPGVLYWRVPGDHRVLDPASDTVVLYDADGTEVSRFTYVRR